MKLILFSVSTAHTFIGQAQDDCVSGDCENGYGEQQCDCGYLYKGLFENGAKTSGKLIKDELHYVGEFKEDMPWGNGAIYFADSSSYRGKFKAAAPHGEGRYYTASGKLYKGEMQNGDYTGFGILFTDSTNLDTYYAGGFENDKKSGYGIEVQPDSLTFGFYRNNVLKKGWVVTRAGDSTFTVVGVGRGSDQKNVMVSTFEGSTLLRTRDGTVEFYIRPGEFVEMMVADDKRLRRFYADLTTPGESAD